MCYDISDNIPLEISIDGNKKKNAIEYARKIMVCETCRFLEYDNYCEKLNKSLCLQNSHEEYDDYDTNHIEIPNSKSFGCILWEPMEVKKCTRSNYFLSLSKMQLLL